MTMRIAIITDCFFPIRKSMSFLAQDLAVALGTELGHDVTVITPRADLTVPWTYEVEAGVKVLSVRLPAAKGRSYPVRLVVELTNPLRLWWRVKRWFSENHHDAIVVFSPSAFWAPLVTRLKKHWRAPVLLVVRDIFPDWAVQLGVLKSRVAFHCLDYLAKKQYRSADAIGVQSKRDLKFLEDKLRGSRRGALHLLYNWRNPFVAKQSADSSGFSQPVPGGPMKFFFGGVFSVSQDTSLIIELARMLHESKARVHMIVVGDGSALPAMKSRVDQLGLLNVTFKGSLPIDDYLAELSQCDVGCLTLDHRYKLDNFPGRFLDVLLCGRPILAAVNPQNEIVDFINQSDIGVAVSSEDVADLFKAAESLAGDPAGVKRMGEKARQLLISDFSVSAAARKIDALIQSMKSGGVSKN